MRDFNFYNVNGEYVGSVRTTDGDHQPKSVLINNVLYIQQTNNQRNYVEASSNLVVTEKMLEESFVLPSYFIRK